MPPPPLVIGRVRVRSFQQDYVQYIREIVWSQDRTIWKSTYGLVTCVQWIVRYVVYPTGRVGISQPAKKNGRCVERIKE
jgi:hypothetical protein